MLLRTVRMTFRPDAVPAFLALFGATRGKIAAQPGCHALALWADPRYSNILTTVSEWTGAEALDAYRATDLFAATWAETKAMFAAPPIAISHVRVQRLEGSEVQGRVETNDSGPVQPLNS